MTQALDTPEPPTTRWRDVPLPPRMRGLPRDRHGRPIPWFVGHLPDGTRDFRIGDATKYRDALRFHLCWVCGRPTAAHKAFTIGPMCAVNRICAEPPTHLDCATYSAQACPFLSVPGMRRRPINNPDVTDLAGGEMILRNPGVILIWITKTYRVEHHNGPLLFIGDPINTTWYQEGRPATRAEVLTAMESGLPTLEDACQRDPDPARSLQDLTAAYQQALTLIPTT